MNIILYQSVSSFYGNIHMASSDSEDCYNYKRYAIAWGGPPLIKKKSRLIAAVVQNQVEVLRDLLDSPKWYNVRDNYGYSLLQIAILRDNIEVFDYMLSIPDFPLEFVNKKFQTALVVALDCYVGHSVSMREHFVYELIKKGACIDKVCFEEDTPLHRALERSYHKAAKLLIEKGVDVNIPNDDDCTPLDLALAMSNGVREVVPTLLVYGAEPSVENFEFAFVDNAAFEVQEVLCLYLYDQYLSADLRLDILLKLAEVKSPLFYHIVECPIQITLRDDSLYTCFRLLCGMSSECLHLVIRRKGGYIKAAFYSGRLSDGYYRFCDWNVICLKNLKMILKSGLKSSMIHFFGTLAGNEIFLDLVRDGCDERAITELYCYLLSYGLNVREQDLQIVYNTFGYCQLFKILLHMDVQMEIQNIYPKDIMPVFVYDVGMNLERFFQNHSNYNKNSIHELLHYFVHPQLNEICSHVDNIRDTSERMSSRDIPLLVEMARNVFRNHFINQFNIRTCREFYSRLNWLPISIVHKKIISYETKLY